MKTIEQRHIDKLIEMAKEPVDYTNPDDMSRSLAYLRGYVRGVMENLTEVVEEDYAEDLMRRQHGSV
jgi:hypothetical protein